MKRRLFGACGVLAVALTVGGCKSDPLSDLDGNPAAVVTDFSYLQMSIGTTAVVTASVLDARTTPLEIPVTFTACTNDVTVAVDTSYHPVPRTSSRAIVTAVSANPSCVRAAGGGVEDTIVVAVLPQAFGGALSSATPQGGDTLTISSTSVLKFDTASVSVTFGGGVAGTIVAKTPDQLKVLVPFSSAAPLSIAGINVTYVSGLIVTLPTANVTQTGDRWGTGDTAYATAPTIAVPAAAGTSFRMITNFGPANGPNCAEYGLPPGPGFSIGPCVIYKFTLSAPTQIRFTADWNSTADIDIYVCDGTGLPGCFESGGSGAGVSKPETITAATYAAGTHYLVLEQFRGPLPTNLFVTIARP